MSEPEDTMDAAARAELARFVKYAGGGPSYLTGEADTLRMEMAALEEELSSLCETVLLVCTVGAKPREDDPPCIHTLAAALIAYREENARLIADLSTLRAEFNRLNKSWGEIDREKGTLLAANRELATALGRIEQWSEFPPATDRQGESIPYGVAYGSNGERDYMRRLATAALSAAKGGK